MEFFCGVRFSSRCIVRGLGCGGFFFFYLDFWVFLFGVWVYYGRLAVLLSLAWFSEG